MLAKKRLASDCSSKCFFCRKYQFLKSILVNDYLKHCRDTPNVLLPLDWCLAPQYCQASIPKVHHFISYLLLPRAIFVIYFDSFFTNTTILLNWLQPFDFRYFCIKFLAVGHQKFHGEFLLLIFFNSTSGPFSPSTVFHGPFLWSLIFITFLEVCHTKSQGTISC